MTLEIKKKGYEGIKCVVKNKNMDYFLKQSYRHNLIYFNTIFASLINDNFFVIKKIFKWKNLKF